MCLTLRSDVEPKIARLSSSYVLLGSNITLVPGHQALPLAPDPAWRRYGMGLKLFSDEERPLAMPIMKRAPDVMDRDALQLRQPREHTSSGVETTRTQWQPPMPSQANSGASVQRTGKKGRPFSSPWKLGELSSPISFSSRSSPSSSS
jgi:hypothetical protein